MGSFTGALCVCSVGLAVISLINLIVWIVSRNFWMPGDNDSLLSTHEGSNGYEGLLIAIGFGALSFGAFAWALERMGDSLF